MDARMSALVAAMDAADADLASARAEMMREPVPILSGLSAPPLSEDAILITINNANRSYARGLGLNLGSR